MCYPPKIHQDNNQNHLVEVVKIYPPTTFISVKNNTPYITHFPCIYIELGKLIGYIDKQNLLASLVKNSQPVTVFFSGPDCYISPSIYTTTQLPT